MSAAKIIWVVELVVFAIMLITITNSNKLQDNYGIIKYGLESFDIHRNYTIRILNNSYEKYAQDI